MFSFLHLVLSSSSSPLISCLFISLFSSFPLVFSSFFSLSPYLCPTLLSISQFPLLAPPFTFCPSLSSPSLVLISLLFPFFSLYPIASLCFIYTSLLSLSSFCFSFYYPSALFSPSLISVLVSLFLSFSSLLMSFLSSLLSPSFPLFFLFFSCFLYLVFTTYLLLILLSLSFLFFLLPCLSSPIFFSCSAPLTPSCLLPYIILSILSCLRHTEEEKLILSPRAVTAEQLCDHSIISACLQLSDSRTLFSCLSSTHKHEDRHVDAPKPDILTSQ